MDHVQVEEETGAAEEDFSWDYVEDSSRDVASSSTFSGGIWNAYRQFVHRNHVSLELLDAGLSRLLFWAPAAGSSNADRRHRQREVLYGILSLHRLAMDTALQQQQQQQQLQKNGEERSGQGLPQDFGMSVRPNTYGLNGDDAKLCAWQSSRVPSPTTIRIALTVLQSLLPSILEVSQSSSSSEQQNNQRRAISRLYLERAKFCLRLFLLGSYWTKLLAQHQAKRRALLQQGERNRSIPPLCVGIMTGGGLFHGVDTDRHGDFVPTVGQEDALWRRRSYVGRRTGRTVLKRNTNVDKMSVTILENAVEQFPFTNAKSTTANRDIPSFFVMAGELLYAYRPLYWAVAEATGSASYRSWILSIFMDLISLQSCRAIHSAKTNPATQAELRRRKMRLLLYFLRSPVWDRWIEPASDRIEAALERVPILGRLASTYLRDYLWYMRHPYESEHG